MINALQNQKKNLYLRIINPQNKRLTKSNTMTTQTTPQEIALTNALKSAYKIRETKTTYIFTNVINMCVELRKDDGSYVDGNFYDNEITQMLFRRLYNIAKSI